MSLPAEKRVEELDKKIYKMEKDFSRVKRSCVSKITGGGRRYQYLYIIIGSSIGTVVI